MIANGSSFLIVMGLLQDLTAAKRENPPSISGGILRKTSRHRSTSHWGLSENELLYLEMVNFPKRANEEMMMTHDDMWLIFLDFGGPRHWPLETGTLWHHCEVDSDFYDFRGVVFLRRIYTAFFSCLNNIVLATASLLVVKIPKFSADFFSSSIQLFVVSWLMISSSIPLFVCLVELHLPRRC